MIFSLGLATVSAQSDTHRQAIDRFCSIWEKAAADAQASKTAAEANAIIENAGNALDTDDSVAMMSVISEPLTADEKTRIKDALYKAIYVVTEKELENTPDATPEQLAMVKQMVPGMVRGLLDPIVDKSETLADVLTNLSSMAGE